MRRRLFIVCFALANVCISGAQRAVTAEGDSGRQVLSGEDILRILPGNTLLSYDESGPFWLYYPGPDAVWGQSSSGDVDVGRWWIEDGRYCRTWQRWYDGATQCWLLASYGDDRIAWMDGEDAIQGESVVQAGNSIGTLRPPIASLASDIEIAPIAVTGAIGPERRARWGDHGASNGAGSTSGGGSSGGGSSGAGSSGAGSSNGSGSGGGSSGGVSSSGGSSSGGGSDDGGSGGTSSGNGKGKGGGGKGNSGDKGGGKSR